MNLTLLPNLCALFVFIGAFRPLARRAGSHTDAWFLAWTFILLHTSAVVMGGGGSHGEVGVRLFAAWTLDLGGLCFLRASSDTSDLAQIFFIGTEAILPLFAQSALVVFGTHRPIVSALCTLLMAGPGIHILRLEHDHRKRNKHLAWGFIASAICLAPFAYVNAEMTLSIVHCLLFLGSAALYLENATYNSRGVFTAVTGLAVWGLVFPLNTFFVWNGVVSPFIDIAEQFPSYLVAYGLIVTIIEDHIRRTEMLAMHDPLTGLPNRRLFEDRLQQVLATASSSGTMMACLVIDVDNFKTTNDTLGHGVGDGLLQAVATRLSWHIYAGDTLARTGGDEFAVVLTRLQSLEHLRFTVGAIMSATSAPVVVDEHEIKIGLSIGIAINPEGSRDADGLRHRADEAMYEAKRSGGNRFAYYGGPPDEVAHLLAGVPEHIRRNAQALLNLP